MFAEYLNQNADMFQRTATRLRRKLWWQNVKLWIILIVILLVILAVIISESLVHVHVATNLYYPDTLVPEAGRITEYTG